MKKIIISAIILLLALPVLAQKKNETGLKREVTLYNPYKPSLLDVLKKNFMPDMTDTTGVKPVFAYHVKTYPFTPPYSVAPVKPAALLPDPLPKLYNSYINLGFGNYITPLAEVSITNQRSKKGAVGFYGRHFSTNGNVELQNNKKVFAGFMDNDASVYGKRFLNGAVLNGSVDFQQKTRYAYGYDTSFINYDPARKDIRLNYYDAGANISLASSKRDSSSLAYEFNLGYDFFNSGKFFYQHNINLSGIMAKEWKGFYAGAKIDFSYYKPSDSVSLDSKYTASVNPFIKKNTSEWNIKLGFTALLDKSYSESARLHLYPDVAFGFNIVQRYIGFFAELNGGMEKNDPLHVIDANPFLLPGKTLYQVKNTDDALVVKAGFRGETGIEGTYRLFASYSIVNNMLFFSNYVLSDSSAVKQRGGYFIPLPDNAEVLAVHGDMNGRINGKITFEAGANYYSYTLDSNEYPWNKSAWDASMAIKYNLRDKIIAGIGMNALGKRKLAITKENLNPVTKDLEKIDMPAILSFNLSAEYRYTKILSFWIKFNNISFSRNYEWAYFPTQRFMLLGGFTYSL